MRYKLSDLNLIIGDGNYSSKYPKKEEFLNEGIPFISASDFNKKYIDYKNAKCISEELNNVLTKGHIKQNDVLVVVRGNGVGKSGYVVDKIDKCNINAQLAFIRSNDNRLNNEYLYYNFQCNILELKKLSTGSAQPQLVISNLLKYQLEIPEIQIQNKIVKILSNIDKIINLVNLTNNYLYEIGRTLYQEFFENEEYTCNYEIKQLSEVTTNNRNKIDQTKEYKVLSAVNTGSLVLSDDYFDKQVYSKDIGKYLNVNKNDFAYNPARINIGSIGLNTFEFNCCVSPVYVTFSVDKDYIDFFDFYFKSKRFNAEVTLRASGSVRQALNYNDFGMIEIPYPTKEMIDKFNSLYKTIKDRINKNKTKISNLEQIRDTLLPKLMNGEIDLDKIEI